MVLVFEELATLGIFASIYVGYQNFSQAFTDGSRRSPA